VIFYFVKILLPFSLNSKKTRYNHLCKRQNNNLQKEHGLSRTGIISVLKGRTGTHKGLEVA